jgi:jumonji domain-containing protein 7
MSSKVRYEHRDEQLVASREALDAFSDNVSSLWLTFVVPIVERETTSLEFCRDFVSKSRPCILRNTAMGLSLPSWTVGDVQALCGNELKVTVNVTPDGHGDSIRTVRLVSEHSQPQVVERAFVLPEERNMRLHDFVEALRDEKAEPSQQAREEVDSSGLSILNQEEEAVTSNCVYYYSMQNDCLRTEFEALLPQLSAGSSELLQWAEAAFGTGPPDALNLWMGNQSATSSLHKDHYENLFYVSSGQKVFTIYPPADAAFLPIESLPTSRFESTPANRDNPSPRNKGTWRVIPELNEDGSRCQTPWIAAPKSGTSSSARLHPIQVVVQQGDILYLPSLWFHQVTQTCETVGVNWWFDMHFDSPLWCYFQLMESSRFVTNAAAMDHDIDEA